MIDARLVTKLHGEAGAERWRVDPGSFARALEASAARAFGGRTPEPAELERYLRTLHLPDLALACACAAGDDEAWQHFVLQHRPLLYRAADTIDPTGGARELADSLYADLFGLGGRAGERQSLFRYFNGRSSLATWLRAVMSQRHVDRFREQKKTDPLPPDDSRNALPASVAFPDPEHDRFVTLMRSALSAAMVLLAPRDRLRLACYYAQQMTLAQTGRLLGEHEATVSRQLSRTRAMIRESVEQYLRSERKLTDAGIDECFRSISEDTGPLDLLDLLGTEGDGALKPAGTAASGKEILFDRSNRGRRS